jgi:hypothetical protein
MKKTALGLSALGFVFFTAPAFAEEQKTESKEETTTGKKGSSYKAEKTTKTGDTIKSTTDQEKVEKSTNKNAKGGMDTETTRTSKHPSSKTTTKEKTETDANGNMTKQEKKTDTNK